MNPELDCRKIHYRQVNAWLREQEATGAKRVALRNVLGQRYIGTGLTGQLRIDVHGIPGNDLGAFADGCTINVYGNAQDAVGNTMNSGRIVIHGRAGDVLGHSRRGGEIFVRSDAGYRVGIHTKSANGHGPLTIIGGMTRDFLGEYMAGGVLIVLGLESRMISLAGNYIGTGMHGGVIYLRGQVEDYKLGKEAHREEMTAADKAALETHLVPYCVEFGIELTEVMDAEFTKFVPVNERPYGRLYTGSVGE